MSRLCRLLIILTGAVLLLAAVLGGVGAYMLRVALQPASDARDLKAAWAAQRRDYPHIRPWLDSIRLHHALRDTSVAAVTDGARLHAWYLPAVRPTGRTALLVHGYTDNALRMLMLGYMYQHDLGCNILLPDLRGAGRTEGDHFQMGWLDRLDVRQWTDVAQHIFGQDSARMVLHGVSMGAATVMMLSGEADLPASVRAFVADCGYTSVWDEFRGELRSRYGLPPFPVLHAASAVCRLRYGWSFGQASALRAVARCHRPMLFIHGTADTYVPFWMMDSLYAAKPQPKQRWAVPGVTHAQSYRAFPQAYTRHVAHFLQPCW